MHDLSIFVGRKHFDHVEDATDLNRKELTDQLIKDPNRICYGTIPQTLIDEYCMVITNIWSKYKEHLEPLTKSIKNAQSKYNKTKEPASKNSMAFIKDLLSKRKVLVHPMLAN